MGVLPLQFTDDMNRESLGLTGKELISLTGLKEGVKAKMEVSCKIVWEKGETKNIKLLCRIDTADEVEYYRHGGILQYVLRSLMKSKV